MNVQVPGSANKFVHNVEWEKELYDGCEQNKVANLSVAKAKSPRRRQRELLILLMLTLKALFNRKKNPILTPNLL